MAVTWRTYSSSVVVSAGLIIGGVLWFDRPGATIMGEDIAELLSAKNEILIYGYATGTNDINYVSNNVSTTMLRSQIYADVLCSARDMMTIHWGRNIFWLSPTNEPPKDGDYLVKVNTLEWTNSVTTIESDYHGTYWTNYYWTIDGKTITNIFDGFVTTATRTSNTVSRLLPFIPDGTHYKMGNYLVDNSRYPLLSTNFPIASLVYGYAVSDQGVLNPFPSGSIWPEIGMGTNIYGYSIEQWYGLENEVNLSTLASFSLSTNKLVFEYLATPKSQTKSVTITSSNSDTNLLRASLSTVSCVGVQNAVFAVSDGDSGNTPMEFNNNYFQITEGSSANLVFRPKDVPGFTPNYEYVVITYDSSKVNVSASTFAWAKNWPYDGIPSAIPWTNYVTLTITVKDDGVKKNDASIISILNVKVSYSGYLESSSQIAIGIVDNDGTPDELTVGNTLLHTTKMGSVNQSITLAKNETNIGIHVSSLITTQNLNEAKTVLQNLTRSVYICAHDVATCASSISTSYSTNTYLSIYTNNVDFPILASDYLKTFDQSMWEKIVSLDDATVTTNTPPSVSGDLFNYWCDTDRWDDRYEWYLDSSSVYDLIMTTVYGFDLTTMLGIKLPYPSLQACASGLVSKVTVFGVFQNTDLSFVGPTISPGYGLGGTNCVITAFDCEAYNVTNDLYKLYGLCSVLCPDRPSKETNNDVTHIDNFSPFYTVFTGGSLRLSKIGEWTNPTSQPTFNLGDAFTPDAVSPSVGYSTISEHDSNNMQLHYTNGHWSREVHLNIDITHFVVVVDWNWQHLNPSAPYTPTPYTPEWVTANTNSP